jgi:hypothetical protein
VSDDVAPTNTLNKYGVAVRGDVLVMLLAPARGEWIARDDALVLAAYLVALADPEVERFLEVYAAVLSA